MLSFVNATVSLLIAFVIHMLVNPAMDALSQGLDAVSQAVANCKLREDESKEDPTRRAEWVKYWTYAVAEVCWLVRLTIQNHLC